jgi:hypothetical protein
LVAGRFVERKAKCPTVSTRFAQQQTIMIRRLPPRTERFTGIPMNSESAWSGSFAARASRA